MIYEGKLNGSGLKIGIVAARFNEFIAVSYTHLINMKNENNIELISPIGETCNKVDLKKAMVPICDEKLSPFASYVGDMHKLNKPKKNTTKMEADFLLEKGHIGEMCIRDRYVHIVKARFFYLYLLHPFQKLEPFGIYLVYLLQNSF